MKAVLIPDRIPIEQLFAGMDQMPFCGSALESIRILEEIKRGIVYIDL